MILPPLIDCFKSGAGNLNESLTQTHQRSLNMMALSFNERVASNAPTARNFGCQETLEGILSTILGVAASAGLRSKVRCQCLPGPIFRARGTKRSLTEGFCAV
jgi:hypothetical protein